MVFFPESKISVNRDGEVKVRGRLEKHQAKIVSFFQDLELHDLKVTMKKGKFQFKGKVDARLQQRIRNYLVNECPLPNR